MLWFSSEGTDRFGLDKNTIRLENHIKTPTPSHTHHSPLSKHSLARDLLLPPPSSPCPPVASSLKTPSLLPLFLLPPLPLSAMPTSSALHDILYGIAAAHPLEPPDIPARFAAATTHLLSLSPSDTGKQLSYQEPVGGLTSLMFIPCGPSEEADILLSLMLERGREKSSTTTNQMDLRTSGGWTPLHIFAYDSSDLSNVEAVLLEYPPALLARTSSTFGSKTPLHLAESVHGDPEITELLRDASAAFTTRDFVTIERICGGSSPYLDRELAKQATALRTAVAICLNRQEEAPSDLISPETGVALALLGRLRDFGRIGNSSDLLRRVLEYVGPYARSGDED